MNNYKIRVKSEAESKEAQGLFFELGGCWATCGRSYNDMVELGDYVFLTDSLMLNYGLGIGKEEITIPQLRDMVVLKRNDRKDSNVSEENCLYDLYLTESEDLYFYHCGKNEWILSNLNGDEDYYKSLKPIEKTMKEYLDPENDYKFIITDKPFFDWIEIPEGAEIAVGSSGVIYFWKSHFYQGEIHKNWIDMKEGYDVNWYLRSAPTARILWQRPAQPEELPFIDDEPTLNNQYAEIEKARQATKETEYLMQGKNGEKLMESIGELKNTSAWDKQEGGSHYKNLAIQPMQYALANKLDYAQANVVKYVTRHADKNGKEDLLKAIHNIELMIEHYYG